MDFPTPSNESSGSTRRTVGVGWLEGLWSEALRVPLDDETILQRIDTITDDVVSSLLPEGLSRVIAREGAPRPADMLATGPEGGSGQIGQHQVAAFTLVFDRLEKFPEAPNERVIDTGTGQRKLLAGLSSIRLVAPGSVYCRGASFALRHVPPQDGTDQLVMRQPLDGFGLPNFAGFRNVASIDRSQVAELQAIYPAVLHASGTSLDTCLMRFNRFRSWNSVLERLVDGAIALEVLYARGKGRGVGTYRAALRASRHPAELTPEERQSVFDTVRLLASVRNEVVHEGTTSEWDIKALRNAGTLAENLVLQVDEVLRRGLRQALLEARGGRDHAETLGALDLAISRGE